MITWHSLIINVPCTAQATKDSIFLIDLSLPVLDIIKLFNPNLLGAAPGKTVHGMHAHISETGFNLAVTGHNTL